MNSLFALACLVILAFGNASVDYCQLHCRNTTGTENIGCNKTLQDPPGELCSGNIEVHTFSGMVSGRNHILHRHNILRHRIAGATHLNAFSKAARMLTMQWDDELAKLAFYNLKQCNGEHDFCHRTEIYNNPGQNLAILTLRAGEDFLTESVLIERATSAWVSGYSSMINPVRDIASFPAPAEFSSRHPAKSFATMILDKNVAVGCSAANYTRYNSHVYTLLCNYAYTIETGERVFANSSDSASGCSRRHIQYSNLCVKADTDGEIRLLQRRQSQGR